MSSIRLSVTDLESFRYWKDSEMELDELLRRLKHEEPPTRAMLAGRALHKILEDASLGKGIDLDADIPEAACDGFKFRFGADVTLRKLPVAELKGEMEIETPSGLVTLVGVVDGLDGTIYDHKLTERFDAERYADSYQWRCYLVMFGGTRFVFNVLIGYEDEALGEWLIEDFAPLTFYAYEGMREDVVREVTELAALVAKYLPEKVAA